MRAEMIFEAFSSVGAALENHWFGLDEFLLDEGSMREQLLIG